MTVAAPTTSRPAGAAAHGAAKFDLSLYSATRGAQIAGVYVAPEHRGQGILIVDGSLSIPGRLEYRGLILVLGAVDVCDAMVGDGPRSEVEDHAIETRVAGGAGESDLTRPVIELPADLVVVHDVGVVGAGLGL